MNQFLKKSFWLAAMVISVAAAPGAYADDLFDDSFLADPAPVDAVKPAAEPAPAPAPAAEPAPALETDAPSLDIPAAPPAPATNLPNLDIPAAPAPAAPEPSLPEPVLDLSIPAPAGGLDIPPPPSDIPAPPAPTSAPNLDFGPSPARSMNLSTPPSEQILGKVSSDIFREMAEMERENNTLSLQLKREQLRSEIDALKSANRQMLFDEIERREKMTQARLEWELAQDLKRQEALERKQKAEIRQKQIEAALKREEERRIQKLKDEEAARIQKEKEEQMKQEQERAELRKKYDAATIVRVNNLKPTLMAITRPPKVKRSPSTRVSRTLTASGEDMLTKKKAGQALTTEVSAEEDKNREAATNLYAVSEIRGTAGSLIAKLISKKDRTTFFVKKSTILPTGHTVIDIDKDFVLVQIGKNKEMIGFPSAGLLGENAQAQQAPAEAQQAPQEEQRRARRRPATISSSVSQRTAGLGGASLAK